MKKSILFFTLLILLPGFASAAIAIAYDAVCNGQDCMVDIESDSSLGRTRITGNGPIAASQGFNIARDDYASLTLVDADKGSVRFKTPEIDTWANAKNLKANVKLGYNLARTTGEPEVFEDEEGNPWISVTNRTLHKENAVFQISGDGSIDSEIKMSLDSRRDKKVFDFSTEGNNSTLNMSINLTGQELIESFEALPDVEAVDPYEAEQIVRNGFSGVLQ